MPDFFVEFSPQRLDFLPTDPVVIIGNLDGVHRGHRQLVEKALELGSNRRPVVALTFSPHPVEVLTPDAGLKHIFSPTDQQYLLKSLGVSGVYYQKFDLQLARMEPRDFLNQCLRPELHPYAVVVGFNFRFGKDRKGGPEDLESWGRDNGVAVAIVPPFAWKGETVSSTLIRQKLQKGDVAAANDLLGFPFFLRGFVIQGSQRGRALGFPTANIECPQTLMPAPGVYATRVSIAGHHYPSVSHLGAVPTFKDPHVRLESFLLDFLGELYEQEITVEFLSRLRDVQTFPTPEALQKQIAIDVAQAKEIHRVTSRL